MRFEQERARSEGLRTRRGVALSSFCASTPSHVCQLRVSKLVLAFLLNASAFS